MVLGIDIGGTGVKLGLVSKTGEISGFKQLDTIEMIKNGFVNSLVEVVGRVLQNHNNIIGIGIGIPGMLCARKETAIDVPAIKELNNVNLYKILKTTFPNLSIQLENDANTAGLGELYYGGHNLNSFLFITLGTGVGSCAIINRTIFSGANGNAMEIGHFPSINNKTLEQNIGQRALIKYAQSYYKENSSEKKNQQINSPKELYEKAKENDQIAIEIFQSMGTLLGEALVKTIRVLDINKIIIGGGMSGALEFIAPALEKKCKTHLGDYYMLDFEIQKATQENNAGLLGAASMIHYSHKLIKTKSYD